jgi:hypothetical protein
MTWYLYKRDDGDPMVSEFELNLDIFPGYEFLGEYAEKPVLNDLKIDNGVLVVDLDKYKERARANIDKRRVRKTDAPIQIDNYIMDGDRVAQDNIKAKLAEVDACIASNDPYPPELMFWNDASNTLWTWPDIESYQSFLQKMLIAMSRRGTLLYAWAWQKKAMINMATTTEEVDALDNDD